MIPSPPVSSFPITVTYSDISCQSRPHKPAVLRTHPTVPGWESQPSHMHWHYWYSWRNSWLRQGGWGRRKQKPQDPAELTVGGRWLGTASCISYQVLVGFKSLRLADSRIVLTPHVIHIKRWLIAHHGASVTEVIHVWFGAWGVPHTLLRVLCIRQEPLHAHTHLL